MFVRLVEGQTKKAKKFGAKSLEYVHCANLTLLAIKFNLVALTELRNYDNDSMGEASCWDQPKSHDFLYTHLIHIKHCCPI